MKHTQAQYTHTRSHTLTHTCMHAHTESNTHAHTCTHSARARSKARVPCRASACARCRCQRPHYIALSGARPAAGARLRRCRIAPAHIIVVSMRHATRARVHGMLAQHVLACSHARSTVTSYATMNQQMQETRKIRRAEIN